MEFKICHGLGKGEGADYDTESGSGATGLAGWLHLFCLRLHKSLIHPN
jgi:hypothetical protein